MVDATRRPAWVTLAALCVLLLAVSVLRPGISHWLPACPFYELTGFYCPGCGATRMLYLLMHGHPLLAVRENLMAAIFLPVVIARLVQRALGLRDALPKRFLAPLGTAVGVAVIAFTIARNVPAEPFRRLAPVPLAELLKANR